MKAYLLKESLSRLWEYRYEGAMLRYLQSWIDQLRWQRLKPFEKLAGMLLDHLEGILNYCRTRIAMGVVEAINGNIKTLLRRGRGYKNLRYLLLKAQPQGGHPNRIRHHENSCLKWGRLRIPGQSQKKKPLLHKVESGNLTSDILSLRAGWAFEVQIRESAHSSSLLPASSIR
jgi:transposase